MAVIVSSAMVESITETVEYATEIRSNALGERIHTDGERVAYEGDYDDAFRSATLSDVRVAVEAVVNGAEHVEMGDVTLTSQDRASGESRVSISFEQASRIILLSDLNELVERGTELADEKRMREC